MSNSNNGLSYDFGVQIAMGVVQGIASAAASAITLVGSMYALINATNELDERIQKNMVSFGGYANTLKALAFTSDKIASGAASGFSQDDMLQGMREMQRAGLDAKKNFDLVAKAATATESRFSDVASAIRSGNVDALAEMGIITDRTAKSVQNMGLTQQKSMQVVLGYLAQADKKGMFENTIQTLPEILNRFKEFGKQLMFAIVGDPKDPEGFASVVKKQLSSIADFFYRNLDTIRKVGTFIGRILKFVAEVAYDFMKGVWSVVKGIGGAIENFFGNFWEKMMSFGLWLEILRVQIKSFFTEYADEIKTTILIVGALMGLSWFGNMILEGNIALKTLGGIQGLLGKIGASQGFTALTGTVITFARGLMAIPAFLLGMVASLVQIVSLIASGVPVATAFSAALSANPLGVMVAAALALLAAGYLIYKNWDSIKSAFIAVFDVVTTMFPLFAAIRMVAEAVYDNWDKIKLVFTQVWEILENVSKVLYYGVLSTVRDVKNFFSSIFDFVVKILSRITLFRTIFDGIKGVVTYIKDVFSDFSSAVGWVLDKVNSVLGRGVAYTAEAAANAQAQYNGAPPPGLPAPTGSTPTSTGSSAPIPVPGAPSTTSTTQVNSNGGNVIQAGAVVINAGNIDEAALAMKIETTLSKLLAKNNSRTGQQNKKEF